MDFFALYTSVGLWNALYVIMYAVTNATKLMKYSTRSTEEIFALFICIAFTVDAFKDAYSDFTENYLTKDCQAFDELVNSNSTVHPGIDCYYLGRSWKKKSTIRYLKSFHFWTFQT